jgi:hypothetical protein
MTAALTQFNLVLGQRRNEHVAERFEAAVEIGMRALLAENRPRDERQIAGRLDEEGLADRHVSCVS